MVSRTLSDWLAHAERQHPVGIDLGLGRVTRVAQALGFAPPDHRPAPRNVIVAGTNGKGSTTVFTEALLRAAGLRVGSTLSPHVHRFNERVRIDGRPVDDAALCAAFEAVESARGRDTLTYFEYSALVALHLFRAAAVDVAVLEVGLGGRLDAFNLVGADVAVVTSIGLDHEAFLGSDLEGIGREKAGVMRAGRDVVLGADVTASVRAEARRLGCRVRAMGDAFEFSQEADRWHYSGRAGTLRNLPWGWLAPYNCSVAIETAACLVDVDEAMVRRALTEAQLPGRCEAWTFDGRLVLVDVAHNPAGAAFLRRLVEARHPGQRFVALVGMLADKDPVGVADVMAALVARWICVPTQGARGQSADALAARLRSALGIRDREDRVTTAPDVVAGLEAAAAVAGHGEGILAFGSFNLVETLREGLAEGKLAPRARPVTAPAASARVTGPRDSRNDR